MRLFFYGTMRDPDVRRMVFGAGATELTIRPAFLPGFRLRRAREGDFPVLVRRTAARAPGELVEGLGRGELLRLLHFEGPAYQPSRHTIIDPEGRRLFAWVLLPDAPHRASGKPWRLRQWQLRHKPRMMPRLRIWMAEFERFEDRSADIAWPARRQLKAWWESGDLAD